MPEKGVLPKNTTLSPDRAQTWTAQLGDKRTSHEIDGNLYLSMVKSSVNFTIQIRKRKLSFYY